MSAATRCMAACFALWGLFTLSGCQNGTAGGAIPPKPIDTPADIEDPQWPFWPTGMQIHPLTRMSTDRASGATVLEARIEFEDAHETTTRAYGQVRLELTDLAGSTPDSYIDVWSVDLRDLDQNVTHFDDVTRTYLFKLQLEEGQVPTQPELRAYFYGADGALLRHRRAVRPYVIEPIETNAEQSSQNDANDANDALPASGAVIAPESDSRD